jgi:hypothetical protein
MTEKHLKYIDDSNKPVITMEEIEIDVETDYIHDTITKNDPEFMLLKAKTAEKQITILDKFSRGQIPSHLPERAKSNYFGRIGVLYDQIKGGTPYVYTPPNKDRIREEIIRCYLDDGYKIKKNID